MFLFKMFVLLVLIVAVIVLLGASEYTFGIGLGIAGIILLKDALTENGQT